ncbi:hypothetical protein HK104_002223 [Borealophlyctis nickersoniae]|nr:hypothetical protein HK104_002223 [Borealophlyctis nickersoniae]
MAGMFTRRGRPTSGVRMNANLFRSPAAFEFMAEQRSNPLFIRAQTLSMLSSARANATPEALQTPEAAGSSANGVSTMEDEDDEDNSHSTKQKRPKRMDLIPPEQIDDVVREIVAKYVTFQGDDWRNVDFVSLSLKFKVVRDCMAACGRQLSNFHLTNSVDVESLIKILKEVGHEKVVNPFRKDDPVEMMFLEQADEIPSNVYFVKGTEYPQIPMDKVVQQL